MSTSTAERASEARTKMRTQHDHAVIVVANDALGIYQLRMKNGRASVVAAHHLAVGAPDGPRYGKLLELLDRGLTLKSPIVVLREPLYRAQVEFIPHTTKRLALRALATLTPTGENEVALREKLATSTTGTSRSQAWHIATVNCGAVDDLVSVLGRRRVRIRKILLDQDLARRSAVALCKSGDRMSDTIVVSVTPKFLDFTCVTAGIPVFARRLAITPSPDLGRRIASELERTSVFFHRRFPEANVTQGLVEVHGAADGAAIVADILASTRLDTVELAPSPDLDVAPEAIVDPADLAPLRWTAALGRSRPANLRGVVTPSIRRARTRRILTPLLGLSLVVFSGLAAFYHAALETRLIDQRELVRSLEAESESAATLVSSWESARRKEEELVARVRGLDALLAQELDVATAVSSVVRLVPDDVRVELVDLAVDVGDPSEERLTEPGWLGTIVFDTGRDYFESADAIERTAKSLESADFLRGADTRISVLPDSLPWSAPDAQGPRGCRFSLRFTRPRS
ncbi:MAG: hypothetical protein R3F20_19530 [Planctomycetota bacterium]